MVAAAANGRRFVGSVNVVCNTNTKLSHAVGDVAGEELVPKKPLVYDVEEEGTFLHVTQVRY